MRIYHDTLVFTLDKKQSKQVEKEDCEFNFGFFQGIAKVLTARIIGRKVKKIFVLIEVLDLEKYLIFKSENFKN